MTRRPAGSEAIKKTFGKRLRAARLAAGMTQSDVGEAIGMDRSYVSEIESGRQNVTIDTMNSLAKAVGLDLDVGLLNPPTRARPRKK